MEDHAHIPVVYYFLPCRPLLRPEANKTAVGTSSASGAGASASSSSTDVTTSCATTHTGTAISSTAARLNQFQWRQRLDQRRRTIISCTCRRHCRNRPTPYYCQHCRRNRQCCRRQTKSPGNDQELEGEQKNKFRRRIKEDVEKKT